MKSILKTIFSVYDETLGVRVHNVIRVLGIKIKFLDKKKTILLYSGGDFAYRTTARSLNRNFSKILININNSSSQLFCQKKNFNLKILSKEFFSLDREIVSGVLRHWSGLNGFLFPVNANSVIYKNHINTMQKGEIAWLYKREIDFIQETIFIKNQNGVIQIKKNAIGESKYFDFEKNYLKDYIAGISLKDYIKGKPIKFQKEIIEKYFNFVFAIYENPETKKFPAWFWDMGPDNVIINENGFDFIDTFLRLKSMPEVEKDYVIVKLLQYRRNLYNYFIKKYNLQDNFRLYEQIWKQNRKHTKAFWNSEGEIQKCYNDLIDIKNFSG